MLRHIRAKSIRRIFCGKTKIRPWNLTMKSVTLYVSLCFLMVSSATPPSFECWRTALRTLVEYSAIGDWIFWQVGILSESGTFQ